MIEKVFDNKKAVTQWISTMPTPLKIVVRYYPQTTEVDWEMEFENMVRYIGTITYGKERWFKETEKSGRVKWYDRRSGDYLTTDQLQNEIYETVKELDCGQKIDWEKENDKDSE